MNDGAPLLALEDIVKDLIGRRVLHSVSMHVARGSIVCLAGGNGAGKTTLLRVAAGILLPDGGRVDFDGLDPRRDHRAYASRLGFTSAGNQGLYARITVKRNLKLWLALGYVPFAERPRVLARTLERFELTDLAERRTDRLSLGQRQRVRLALTFANDPLLVLLDEPHTSLDDEGIGLLGQAMQERARAGGAVVWAAPSPDHAGLPYDAVVRLENGEVVA